jgi:acetyltransferase-like isoleucine patch superfamily enzyme
MICGDAPALPEPTPKKIFFFNNASVIMVYRRIKNKIKYSWEYFWMRFSGMTPLGRAATWFAAWFTPPYKSRCHLARLSVRGYIAPSARINHDRIQFGGHVFIGDRVIIYKSKDGGPVELCKGVHLYSDIIIETGEGGSVKIGADTHIQPRCQFSAYKGSIVIGCGVQIAPNCAFYPYNHGFAPDEPIKKQSLQTKGGIVIEDDAWLGFGAIVLDGVKIGKGAVVGAGSVVTRDIPDGAITVGVPARIVKMRADIAINENNEGKYPGVIS